MKKDRRTNNDIVIYRPNGQIVRVNDRCPQVRGSNGYPQQIIRYPRQDDIIDADWCFVNDQPNKKKKKKHHKKKCNNQNWNDNQQIAVRPQYIPMVRQESALDRLCNDLIDNGQLDISINRNGTQLRYSHRSGFNIGFNLNNRNDSQYGNNSIPL